MASVLEIISNHLCDTYKRTRFTPKGAEWPPNIPKLIVSVALIHYKGKRTQQELFEMASVHKEGTSAIDNFTFQGPSTKKPRLDYSRVTKNITDIFAADPTDLTETDTSSSKVPKRILIEGAPGIGKTVLAKEISYQWTTNEILTEIKIVFLLYLRDPQLQLITTTKQLVEYMSMGCLHGEKITTLVEYLVNTQGQQLCIVMDGFDEYPNTLQENSFIVDIINRAVLPEAIVVITSRPTATVSLHDQVDRRIDILGLPKEEREKYISQAFSNAPDKKVELERHLKKRPVINGLCFVPLHLAILLYLFRQGCLPETLTEMNESFILHTIYRHLKRHRVLPTGSVKKLANVPEPVLDVVYKLSKLAFNGLQENKLVFTFDEVKAVCPHVDETVGAINGFGLLQAVQHYPSEGAGTTTSLNFLHYTMQEFLSALHVSNLPPEQQSSLMKKTFWDGHYNFMWMMFVGIVGIESDIFVNFVSKGKEYKNKIGIRMTENILSDKRKRLHVFQCYMEAKSSADAPDVISDMFKDGKINIKGVKLLPHHISSLMTYVSNSSMRWHTLQLNQCNITDIGMSVLEQFISENVTFGYVDLRDNNSSPWGVYCAIIRYCSVDSLTLCGDKGIEDYVNEIKDCLLRKTKLISIKLYYITDIGAINIAEAIQMNSTLQNINISYSYISTQGFLYLLKAFKNNCTLQVVDITHNNFTRSGFTSIKQCIENLQHPIQIIASWNEINEGGKLVAKIFTSRDPGNIKEDVWSFCECDGDHLVMCLSECLKEDHSVKKVDLNYNDLSRTNKITKEGAIKITEAIKVNKTVRELQLGGNNISNDGAATISDALKSNDSLQILDISFNQINGEGAIKVAEAIKVNKTLLKLDMCRNKISDDGAAAISDALKSNNSLQILNISFNQINGEGAIKVAEAIKVNKTVRELQLGGNNISNDGAATISDALKSNDSLQILDISFNQINGEGAIKVAEAIKVNKTVQKLYISCNNISDDGAAAISDALKSNNSLQMLCMPVNKITSEGAKVIAEAIKVNKTVQELRIYGNYISDDGAAAISDALKSNNSLQILSMASNYITSEGAKVIAEAIKVNKTLQKLEIHGNKISDDGAAAISDALKSNNSLQILCMPTNKITSQGAKVIAEAIKVNATLHTLDLYQSNINDAVSFNMSVLTAVYHNNTLMTLELPFVLGNDKRLVSSEVEKINLERTRQGISTLTCHYYNWL